MSTSRCLILGAAFALLPTLVACSGGDGGNSVKLNGAGATFPAPLYSKWFKAYNAEHPEIFIGYQSVGSSQGVTSMIDGTVDFGASDAAMDAEEMSRVKRGVQLLPVTAGSIVLAYNLDGVDNLQLSREAYAGIFLGTVTKWNDPLIADENQGANLPATDINVVVRSDGSGTTYVFSKHLSEISPQFAASPGTHKLPAWPVGSKSKGNEGVTGSIKTTPGSIGYVEFGYADNNGLKMAALENKSQKFIQPTMEAFQAGLEAADFDENLVAWVPDPAGEAAYPIVTFTWLLCYKEYESEQKLNALKEVILYCLDEGQKESPALGYIPLPPSVVEKCKAALGNIKASESKPAAATPAA